MTQDLSHLSALAAWAGNAPASKSEAGGGGDIAGLFPGYEARRTISAARFAPRAAGGATQRLKTPGRVPEETRPYQAGDPVHLIDWYAFGRTDQLILRQRREQAPQHVVLRIALHDSMDWPDPAIPVAGVARELQEARGILASKAELAWRLALFMAHALLRRGDVVDLSVEGGATEAIWRPSGARMVTDAFEWMVGKGFVPGTVPGNLMPHAPVSREVIQSMERRGNPRIVFIGDALASEGDAFMDQLVPGDLFIHVLSDLEVSDAWRPGGDVYMDELPGTAAPRRHEWQGQWLSERLPEARAGWLGNLDRALNARGVSGVRLTGTVPAVAFIAAFESWCGGAG